MRLAAAMLVLGALAACSGDDDDEARAQSVTTTSSTTTTCDGADPVPPPGEVVATAGDLLLVADAAGASADVVAVFGLVGCAYEQLELDGRPASLAYGGTVTHGDGIRCGGADLTVLSATSDDGITYAATSITYEPDGGRLVEVDRATSTIDATTEPEVLDPYYRLDCEAP